MAPSRRVVESPDAALAAGVARYLAALGPDAPVRIGLLSNPMAQTNWRSVAHARLLELMPDPTTCLTTPSVADLPWALDLLLFEKAVNVLVVNGGDGTIHAVVNACLARCAKASRAAGKPVPMPSFLFVNGGGMNMLARAFQTRGHPVRTLRRFLRGAGRKPLGEIPTREVPLLAIDEEGRPPLYGFIFGSELVLNALTMYERFGRGYRGLARFFGAVVSGPLLESELWQRFGHYLDPPTTPIAIDGEVVARYVSAVASTVPMTLLKGLVRTLPTTASRGTMNGIVVTAPTRAATLGTIPFLLVGAQGPGFRYVQGLRSLELQGPYTVDGERITRPAGGRTGVVRVHATDLVVRGACVD